jgi:hypothetical protein
MWQASQRFLAEPYAGKEVVLIHLGDHDPSGIDMSRDIEDRIRLFMGDEQDQFQVIRIALNMDQVIRIALNMDQVDEYGPPPNPAKLTDSRCAGYMSKFGSESWELDALEPSVLNGLVTQTIEGLIDDDAWNVSLKKEWGQRQQLVGVVNNFDDIVTHFGL